MQLEWMNDHMKRYLPMGKVILIVTFHKIRVGPES